MARRLNAIDRPRERSLHEAPTPKLGGLAILCGVLVAGVLFLPWAPLTRAILGGAALIAAVGVLDDVFDLPAGLKLLGQVVAAMIPVFNGVWVSDFTLPFVGGVHLDHVLFHQVPLLGNVRVGHVLTVLGFVAVMNVINFIDGVDGLAAGVCVISAATFAIIALSLDRPGAGVLAAATAGASLGFLRHGFPPASSFMGDTGSNLLGYLLATVAVLGALKTNAVVALFFPLIVLAVPILDGGFVIAKRLKYGRPVYEADRSHFHHRMANIGFSQRRTLLYLYGWALVLAGLALALRFVPYSDNHGQLQHRLDGGDGGLRRGGARRQRVPGRRARDPQAAPLPPPSAGWLARPGRPPAGGGGRGRRARARDGQLRRPQSRDRGARGDRPRHGGVRGDRTEMTRSRATQARAVAL